MKVGDVAGAVGKGLAAGVVGTAAMTVSSTIEAKVRKRKGSTAPADAAEQVLGVEPINDAAKARFSNLVHWAYGTSWGGVRGALGGLGLTGAAGTSMHFAALWGSELVMLPALGVVPPVSEWGATELAIDAWHHIVYVVATSLAYTALVRASSADR